LAGVRARGASKKFRTPLLISATTETSNFKFGTQLGFGEQGSGTRVDTKKLSKKPGKKTHPTFDPVSFLVVWHMIFEMSMDRIFTPYLHSFTR